MGHGTSPFVDSIKKPVDAKRVLYAGLIEEDLRPSENAVHSLGINIASPEDIAENSKMLLSWIKANGVTQLAVHFDLDVLSPEDFRSILPAKPYLEAGAFGAAVGRLTLAQIVRLLNDLNKQAEIVGLCIAEHMPWDAMNLRNALRQMPLFGNS